MPDLKDDPKALAHVQALIDLGYNTHDVLNSMVTLDPRTQPVTEHPQHGKSPFDLRVSATAWKLLADRGVSEGDRAVFSHLKPQRRGTGITLHPRRVLHDEIRQAAGRSENDESPFTAQQISTVERDFDGIVVRAADRLFPAKAS